MRAFLAVLAALCGTAQPCHADGGARERELVRLVRQDCGSCHGMTLKGGLGPALLPEVLANKPAPFLATVILHGIPGTPMPGWSRFLSDADAGWITARLQSGFPQE